MGISSIWFRNLKIPQALLALKVNKRPFLRAQPKLYKQECRYQAKRTNYECNIRQGVCALYKRYHYGPKPAGPYSNTKLPDQFEHRHFTFLSVKDDGSMITLK